MRLIDADLFLENVRKELNCDERCCECVHDNLCEIYKMTLEQPTAFDLESVIEQIKDKGIKICCSVKCNDDCENCEHGILMKSIIETLKSAANATNGKIGG